MSPNLSTHAQTQLVHRRIAETAPQVAPAGEETQRPLWRRAAVALLVFALLYVFLVSISMLGTGVKLFGKDFADALIRNTANPFVGLFIGILATSVVQSSSTITSMVVAFVASGTLSVEGAIPIVMGANIGTTVTATLVSLAHMTRRQEFRLALSAATVHDFFNVIAVAVLLPLELATGFLQRGAQALAGLVAGSGGVSFASPIKAMVSPVVGFAKGSVGGLVPGWGATVLVLVSLVLLFLSLYFLTRLLRKAINGRVEGFFRKTIRGSGALAMLLGLVITAVVQSSSVTTSLMVPMAAAGALTLEQIFPITLGANVGTTVTALLAALAGNVAGLTIAFVHLLFNVVGILLIYPVPAIRRIPIGLARRLGELGARSRGWAIAFVAGVFFIVPGVLVFLYRVTT